MIGPSQKEKKNRAPFIFYFLTFIAQIFRVDMQHIDIVLKNK